MTTPTRAELEAAMAGKLRGPRRHKAGPKGHPMPPGSGPSGSTCRDCRHYAVVSRRYRKCEANAANWTHSIASDIRARDPACAVFAPAREE